MSHLKELQDFERRARNAEESIATARTQKSALDAAITAAELYLNAYRLASSAQDKKRLDARCNALLTRAETIKKSGNWAPPSPAPPAQTSSPSNTSSRFGVYHAQSSRALSKREQIILLEGSKLHGSVFPPWQGLPDPKEFEERVDGSLYEDEQDELRLSDEQKESFADWKRPDEALARHGADKDAKATMVAENPLDLVQDATTDCSVVASMCAVVAHTVKRPGRSQLFFKDFFPQDEVTHSPILSRSGKYILRFFFNGCHRKITIDDRLPTSHATSSSTLHVIDRNNPSLLWPSLIEKAYLKVRGGYDFPGSNSGTDLWILTGWIPEQIFLHDEESEMSLDEIWTRVFDVWEKGDVLVTIGTGELTEEVEKEIGLIGMHDYAILDMRERDGEREMLVKNPWASGVAWRGIVSSGYGDDTVQVNEAMKHLDLQRQREEPLSPGTFWMNCEQIIQNFEHMYLNWNPSLLPHREDIHFTWDLSSIGDGIPGSFVTSPQFAFTTASTGGTVWLLLSRHFKTDDGQGQNTGFISICVFDNTDGKRVYLSDRSWRRGPFVDSPNTLLRLETPANRSYTVVPSVHNLTRSNHNFTLSAFSAWPLTLSHAAEKYAHCTEFESAWTLSTAGGNTESPRYLTNPQFSVQITEQPCSVAIFLETSSKEIAANVKLLWSNGRRVTSSIGLRDIAIDSGDYRRGCALAESEDIPRGSFTLVCSTFKEDQLGKFTLWIHSTKPCLAKPLPAEGAGRLSIPVEPAIFRPGVNRMLAPLTVYRLTRLKVIAKRRSSFVISPNEQRIVQPSPILMSIEQGRRPFSDFLTFSGDGSYDDSATGVRIEDVDLTPEMAGIGGLWLVIERNATDVARKGAGSDGTGVEDTLEIEILAEHRITVGSWRVAPEYDNGPASQ